MKITSAQMLRPDDWVPLHCHAIGFINHPTSDGRILLGHNWELRFPLNVIRSGSAERVGYLDVIELIMHGSTEAQRILASGWCDGELHYEELWPMLDVQAYSTSDYSEPQAVDVDGVRHENVQHLVHEWRFGGVTLLDASSPPAWPAIRPIEVGVR